MADGARRRPSGFAYVYDRSVGLCSRFPQLWRAQQSRGLRAVARNFVYRRGMKAWALALDPVDARFLLVGTSRSHVLLYDLRALDNASHSSDGDFSAADADAGKVCFDTNNPLPPETAVHARKPTTGATASALAPGLQYGVSSVDWYPVDGGLFVSSAFDGHVKLWDSDAFEVVGSFALRSRVYCAKFSPVATTHALIAAATAKGEVRLCDMHVNAAVHSLLGHRDEVWTLAWSPVDEHLLATGARDGEIRLWDIRRSGSTACLLALNLEGPAVVPGRSSLHASASSKRGLASTLAGESSRKRQRLTSSTERASTNPLRVRDRSPGNLPARITGRTQQQRNDPHAAASTSFVSAHRAGVNALAFTPNGHFLLSSGLDHALRLWNSATGEHQFMNYEKVENNLPARPVQMAVVQEADARSSTLVYHPNGRHGELNAYSVFGDNGQPLMRATAHYEQISAVVYRHERQELYSAGDDGLIMRWRPPPAQLCPEPGDDDEVKPRASNDNNGDAESDEDTWSEDDEPGGADHRFIPPILRE
jgi:DNA excision repair protein ERCC-8